jgi:anhydro-N-acetylmuramic acid kinase
VSPPLVTALGMITGTSMDAIDLALVTSDGDSRVEAGPTMSADYPTELRAAMRRLIEDPSAAAEPQPALDRAMAEAHAQAVDRFLAEHAARPSLIGFHGQTVLHRPDAGITRQIGDGQHLADLTGLPVVSGFRLADVAAGGQGAPLAPAYHAALAGGLKGPLAVLNLGGVGNVTYIDVEALIAFDTGPANGPLDDWAARHTGQPCDRDGALAAAGRADAERVKTALAHPYFERPPPKSLDRQDFTADMADGMPAADGAATLMAISVASVVASQRWLPAAPRRWLVCGGGRRNPVMMAALAEALSAPVDPVEAVGWDGDALEAQAFAYLAIRSSRGLAVTYPGTTGAPKPMTGGVVHQPFEALRA